MDINTIWVTYLQPKKAFSKLYYSSFIVATKLFYASNTVKVKNLESVFCFHTQFHSSHSFGNKHFFIHLDLPLFAGCAFITVLQHKKRNDHIVFLTCIRSLNYSSYLSSAATPRFSAALGGCCCLILWFILHLLSSTSFRQPDKSCTKYWLKQKLLLQHHMLGQLSICFYFYCSCFWAEL